MRPQLIPALWVETKRWFIKEEDPWCMQKSAGDFQAPLHPAGKLLHQSVSAVPQFKKVEQHFGSLAASFLRNVVENSV